VRGRRLVVDPTACDGHGLCRDLFPEGIGLDDWGYPIVTREVLEGAELRLARRAVAVCPKLALHLEAVAASDASPAGRRR
jgi:ferredoxin